MKRVDCQIIFSFPELGNIWVLILLTKFSALRCVVDSKGFDIFLDYSEACRSAGLSNWDERSPAVNNLFCD